MNKYRPAALALAACAASASVAACSAGISTATTSPATSPAGPSRSASQAMSSPSPASSGHTISISGSIGSFPVPAGAKVAENIAEGKQIIIMFSSVTPANVSSFYAAALPRAGYAISGNSIINEGGATEAIIEFTGHGYKGDIGAVSHFSGSGVSVPGLGTKNVTTIALMPK
jgi:ABC-type phosphate transport system substrate-binding protein